MYRELSLTTRPSRFTVLIPEIDWQHHGLRVIEILSRTWGGRAATIVPCSSEWEVPNQFWKQLHAYDPDRLSTFQVSLRALQIADPARFEDLIKARVQHHVAEHGGSEEAARDLFTSESSMDWGAGPWPPSQDLQDQIRSRLAPLGSEQLVFTASLRADVAPTDPFVDITRLRPRPDGVRLLDTSDLPIELQLLILAETGALNSGHRLALEEAGIPIAVTPVRESNLGSALRLIWTGRPGLDVGTLAKAIAEN